MTDNDIETIEELIRKKELGGLPGTKVKLSPKSPSPNRSRSIEGGVSNALDNKLIDVNLK